MNKQKMEKLEKRLNKLKEEYAVKATKLVFDELDQDNVTERYGGLFMINEVGYYTAMAMIRLKPKVKPSCLRK